MELKQLEYFVTSVEVGSFKQAARSLYTTQPNVSKIIHSLEEELGTTLLKRNPRGVTLTSQGTYVYNNVKQMLPYVEQIRKMKAMVEAGESA